MSCFLSKNTLVENVSSMLTTVSRSHARLWPPVWMVLGKLSADVLLEKLELHASKVDLMILLTLMYIYLSISDTYYFIMKESQTLEKVLFVNDFGQKSSSFCIHILYENIKTDNNVVLLKKLHK